MTIFNINPSGSTQPRFNTYKNNNSSYVENTQYIGSRLSYSSNLINDQNPNVPLVVGSVYSQNNYTFDIRSTLTNTAMFGNHYNFYSGKFDNGFPLNDVYSFCNQRLTSVFNYGSIYKSRLPTEDSILPQAIAIGDIPVTDANNECDCGILSCPPGQTFDPASCKCVSPPICIPQPSCEPTEIPVNLKSLVKGYAFYLDRIRLVDIPEIGLVQATCGGGHFCCSTLFKPQLINGATTINANKNISMNNLLGNYPIDCFVMPQCCDLATIPVPGFIKETPFEVSDSFEFNLPDPSLLNSDTAVTLDCQYNSCHNGVTFIVLVGYKVEDDSPVLLFASCVAPGSLTKKIGIIDCPGPISPCDPPPPPPPQSWPDAVTINMTCISCGPEPHPTSIFVLPRITSAQDQNGALYSICADRYCDYESGNPAAIIDYDCNEAGGEIHRFTVALGKYVPTDPGGAFIGEWVAPTCENENFNCTDSYGINMIYSFGSAASREIFVPSLSPSVSGPFGPTTPHAIYGLPPKFFDTCDYCYADNYIDAVSNIPSSTTFYLMNVWSGNVSGTAYWYYNATVTLGDSGYPVPHFEFSGMSNVCEE